MTLERDFNRKKMQFEKDINNENKKINVLNRKIRDIEKKISREK